MMTPRTRFTVRAAAGTAKAAQAVFRNLTGLTAQTYALATRTQPDEVLGSRSDYTAKFS